MVLSTNRPSSESAGRDSNCTSRPYRAGRRRPATVSSVPADAATWALRAVRRPAQARLRGQRPISRGRRLLRRTGRRLRRRRGRLLAWFRVAPPAGRRGAFLACGFGADGQHSRTAARGRVHRPCPASAAASALRRGDRPATAAAESRRRDPRARARGRARAATVRGRASASRASPHSASCRETTS